MNGIILVGIIIISGYILGELVDKIGLPKVTGYILAGILLSPEISTFVPKSFVEHTDIVTNISLSIITFSVGGTLLISKIKKMGKRILRITFFESNLAFVIVVGGFVVLLPFFLNIENADYLTVYLPFSLMLGSLAAPTDPTATLAVAHEYKAKGKVISTIMGVAAFDDAIGIMLYSIAIAFAGALVSSEGVSIGAVTWNIGREIFGALIVGGIIGFVFNKVTRFLTNGSEGMIIVLVVGFLSLNFGISSIIEVDELLAIMFMGFVVVNFNEKSDQIFGLLERYTEQLIFVLFFTISGMHLDIFVIRDYWVLVLLYVVLRSLGKFIGTYIGARKSPKVVRRYTSGGLIPQGGIVIGLALMIKQNPDFAIISNEFINIILGATVLHELIGPVLAKLSLKKAGEIE